MLMHATLLLLTALVELLLILVIWRYWQARTRGATDFSIGARDDLLLGLLVLAAFALGAFLTYVLPNARLSWQARRCPRLS